MIEWIKIVKAHAKKSYAGTAVLGSALQEYTPEWMPKLEDVMNNLATEVAALEAKVQPEPLSAHEPGALFAAVQVLKNHGVQVHSIKELELTHDQIAQVHVNFLFFPPGGSMIEGAALRAQFVAAWCGVEAHIVNKSWNKK